MRRDSETGDVSMRSAELAQLVGVLTDMQPAFLEASFDQQRMIWDAVGGQPFPDGYEIRSIELGGVPAELVTAPGADARRLVVHFHGGGYAIGSSVSHRQLAGRISAASGAPVAVPDYRLAPEHPFPAAFDDACSVYTSVADQAPSIALSGDSAGGGLAIAAAVDAVRKGLAAPAALVTWSPWADLAVDVDEEAGVDDPVIDRKWLAACRDAYLGAAPVDDPSASPIHADLAGLPGLLVLVGTSELLLGDSRRIAALARDAGVEVELIEVEGAVHLWMMLAPGAPESLDTVGRVGSYIERRLASARAPVVA
ncbi:MAG: alpha/beta hydrolase [Acidimicrobiales bacterium]